MMISGHENEEQWDCAEEGVSGATRSLGHNIDDAPPRFPCFHPSPHEMPSTTALNTKSTILSRVIASSDNSCSAPQNSSQYLQPLIALGQVSMKHCWVAKLTASTRRLAGVRLGRRERSEHQARRRKRRRRHDVKSPEIKRQLESYLNPRVVKAARERCARLELALPPNRRVPAHGSTRPVLASSGANTYSRPVRHRMRGATRTRV